MKAVWKDWKRMSKSIVKVIVCDKFRNLLIESTKLFQKN